VLDVPGAARRRIRAAVHALGLLHAIGYRRGEDRSWIAVPEASGAPFAASVLAAAQRRLDGRVSWSTICRRSRHGKPANYWEISLTLAAAGFLVTLGLR